MKFLGDNEENKENEIGCAVELEKMEAGEQLSLHSPMTTQEEDLSDLRFQVVNLKTKFITSIPSDLAFTFARIIQDEDCIKFRNFLKKVSAKYLDDLFINGEVVNDQGLRIKFEGNEIIQLLAFLGKNSLLKKNIDLGADKYRSLCIMLAVMGNQTAVLQSCFELAPSSLGKNYSHALNYNRTGNPEITRLFLEKGAIQIIDEDGFTPLIKMIHLSKDLSAEKKKNYWESVKLLLENDSRQINVKSREGWPAYSFAMENQDLDMMSLLLKYRPEINKTVFNWILSARNNLQEKYIDYINLDAIKIKLSSEEFRDLIYNYGKELRVVKGKLFNDNGKHGYEPLFLAKSISMFQNALDFYGLKNLFSLKNNSNQNLLENHLNYCQNGNGSSGITNLLLNQEGLRWFSGALHLLNKKDKMTLVNLLSLDPSKKNYLFRLWLRDNLSAEAKKEFEELLSQQAAPAQCTFLDSAKLQPWHASIDVTVLTELFNQAREKSLVKGQFGVADLGLAILGKRWGLPCLVQKKIAEIKEVRIELSDLTVFSEAASLLYWLAKAYEEIVKSITDFDPCYESAQESLKSLMALVDKYERTCRARERFNEFDQMIVNLSKKSTFPFSLSTSSVYSTESQAGPVETDGEQVGKRLHACSP